MEGKAHFETDSAGDDLMGHEELEDRSRKMGQKRVAQSLIIEEPIEERDEVNLDLGILQLYGEDLGQTQILTTDPIEESGQLGETQMCEVGAVDQFQRRHETRSTNGKYSWK